MYPLNINFPLEENAVVYFDCKDTRTNITLVDKFDNEYPYYRNGEDLHIKLPKGFHGELYWRTATKTYTNEDVWDDYKTIVQH